MSVVDIPRGVLNSFKRLAKKAAPKETYALLLGHNLGCLVAVTRLWVPPDVAECSSDTTIAIRDSWIHDAQEEADELGERVVGWVHSHVNYEDDMIDHAPSESDWAHSPSGLFLVCLVRNTKSGRKRATFKAWGRITPVDLRVSQ